jgi:hypothetical protein
MPFDSKAQQRKCYALKARGEAGSWDCDEFSAHTDFEKLPEKAAELGWLAGLRKQAEGPYGAQNVGFQEYLPVQDQRELSETEKKRIEKAQSNWFPKIFESYQTPLPQMMSSPGRAAILAGLLGGTAGAGMGGLAGAAFGSEAGRPGLGAGIGAGLGGLGLGGLTALTAYFGRRQENEDLEDLMTRLPEGATKRDMLSDPVVQKDLERQIFMRSRNFGGGGLSSGFAGGLAANAFD